MLALALCGSVGAAEFSFAAFADTPYSADEEARFPEMIAEMGRENLAFVVHVGDFKAAWTTCSDEIFLQRREWFDQSQHPFIFVPGDNEWVDCRRPLGAGRDPFERLDRLRELFFSRDTSLGQRRLPLTRQSSPGGSPRYPEHLRWEREGVLFLTLNAPGPNNYTQAADYAARDQAARLWLTQSFAMARARKLRGVVVFMHGDPWSPLGQLRKGFAKLMETLAVETRAFDGAVLLVNADSHRYVVDGPLRDPATNAPLANFLRVMVFGTPSMRWVRIRVSETAGRAKFDVTPGD